MAVNVWQSILDVLGIVAAILIEKVKGRLIVTWYERLVHGVDRMDVVYITACFLSTLLKS